ncbi:multidrug/biocide efflux PACE transporter [Zophobihabitans entericus]|uniref:Multidrug/biocide efflux PACE transporter n=1 Tax=Zophobihabitans entericus TaxID=1635327 RepID=A0A6G9ICQ3_9GAMM|nr:multidrug/biocide efflux PACE transporter [Zophobihabitans entericus]QIQ22003.1 multidrug/biocide efflux PACE transporter [Zophobihabitans entericus]
MNKYSRTLYERIFHAVCFEVIAILITAPASALIMNRPIFDMGALAVILSTAAMLWNVIYNFIFDVIWPVIKYPRTMRVRALHAVGFEVGFGVLGIGLIISWLGITILQALMLEIGFLLFFLPYTMVYNWIYDYLREKVINRKTQKLAAQEPRY